jgi:hypothetical protein
MPSMTHVVEDEFRYVLDRTGISGYFIRERFVVAWLHGSRWKEFFLKPVTVRYLPLKDKSVTHI